MCICAVCVLCCAKFHSVLYCITVFFALLTRPYETYGGKEYPCLYPCPFVPVCPFVPEFSPGTFTDIKQTLIIHKS